MAACLTCSGAVVVAVVMASAAATREDPNGAPCSSWGDATPTDSPTVVAAEGMVLTTERKDYEHVRLRLRSNLAVLLLAWFGGFFGG